MPERVSRSERSGEPTFSALAWELARHASFRTTERYGGVEAAVVVSSATLVTGVGHTTTDAMRDLAQNLDKWAACDDK